MRQMPLCYDSTNIILVLAVHYEKRITCTFLLFIDVLLAFQLEVVL